MLPLDERLRWDSGWNDTGAILVFLGQRGQRGCLGRLPPWQGAAQGVAPDDIGSHGPLVNSPLWRKSLDERFRVGYLGLRCEAGHHGNCACVEAVAISIRRSHLVGRHDVPHLSRGTFRATLAPRGVPTLPRVAARGKLGRIEQMGVSTYRTLSMPSLGALDGAVRAERVQTCKAQRRFERAEADRATLSWARRAGARWGWGACCCAYWFCYRLFFIDCHRTLRSLHDRQRCWGRSWGRSCPLCRRRAWRAASGFLGGQGGALSLFRGRSTYGLCLCSLA